MANVPQNEFEKVSPPTLPKSQQAVATQAFESAVSPLREQFGKQIEGTVESLAKRGVQFGGVGAERLGDVFKEQRRIEGEIAGRLGAQLGQTALEQAFASSEASKSRALQRELQQAGFGETQRGREFVATEAEKQRGLQRELQQIGFGETQRGREFVASEAEKQRGAVKESQLLSQSFTKEQQQRQIDANQTAQQAAQDFSAEQALLGRTFTREEAQLQRSFQQALVDSEIGFKSEQADIDRQLSKNQAAINLALSGNIQSGDIGNIIEDTFGPGVTLTTRDEADLQRLSTAAGLGVDDYMAIRRAIGQGQLRDVMENPEDYVESPQKARDFQLQLTLLANKSASEIAEIESDTGPGTIQQIAEAPLIIPKRTIGAIGSIF